MKKTILIIVLAALCLNFGVKAQDKPSINALKIGDQVPDITINNIINYKSADGNPITSAKISDFKGKLLILDFWATWCSPCIAMMPKMDDLQKEFSAKVQFLPIAYQPETEVKRFLSKRQRSFFSMIPQIVSDKEMGILFPHTYLPHYVWINPEGYIIAITSYQNINANQIRLALDRKPIDGIKNDPAPIAFDENRSFLDANNGISDQDVISYSVIARYKSGLVGGYTFFPSDEKHGKRLVAKNLPLSWLFRLAFSDQGFFGRNRTSLDVADTGKIFTNKTGNDYLNWCSQGNAFCYEITAPKTQDSTIYALMRYDLKKFFPQYLVSVEIRKSNTWALIRTSDKDKIKTNGAVPVTNFTKEGCHLINVPLDLFLARLNIVYQQKSSAPLTDQTGYKGNIDLDINANLNDLASINEAIKVYDLKFVEQVLPVSRLVIKDAPSKF